MTRRNWIFTVDAEEVHLRLDQCVSARTGLSRRQVRQILQWGGVQVNQQRVRVASKPVKLGAEIRVAVDDTLGPLPDCLIPVLYEDAWLLVVNKPAGLPTQGTQASDQHDLLAILKRQRPGQRLLLQHRLDQGTSGVLVFAKDPKADLGHQFQGREVQKTYVARISQPLEACVVEAPVGRLRGATPARFGCPGMALRDRRITEADLMDPKPSLTAFEPLVPEVAQALCSGWYVVARPRTGRTHQIRVHLASLGLPIHGDGLYGGADDPNLWLHAWSLELVHPITGAPMVWTAPLDRFRSQP